MQALSPPAPAEDWHDGHRFWTAPPAHHEIVSYDRNITEMNMHGCVRAQSADR